MQLHKEAIQLSIKLISYEDLAMPYQRQKRPSEKAIRRGRFKTKEFDYEMYVYENIYEELTEEEFQTLTTTPPAILVEKQ
jgi:hypothetical protein